MSITYLHRSPVQEWELILEEGIRDLVEDLTVWHRWDLLTPEPQGFAILKPRGWRERQAGEVPFG